jgi:broad specificity phosphatase PhoE
MQAASETYLVRHGQASARAADYDVLSPLGVQQAERLGRHLAQQGLRVDGVFSGPRRRQRDTAQHMVAAARAAGMSLPDPVELSAGDEIPLDAILQLWLPRVIAEDPGARALAERNFDGQNGREIQRVLITAMQAWAAGEVVAPSLPTFAQFSERVAEALHEVRRAGPTTLLVTSAGPVATAMRLAEHAEAATPSDVMRLAMGIGNASLTRVKHDGERLSLVATAFDVSHLPPEERTLI